MHTKKYSKSLILKTLVIAMIYMLKVIHYYLLMYLRILEINALKNMNLIQLLFLPAPGLAWQACLKKTKVKLELLTDIDMLLMVGKGIRRGMCHAIHRYVEANNKYMKNYDKKKRIINLYGWAMSQKLPVNEFKWVKDTLSPDKKLNKFVKLIKNYDEDSNKGYILEVDVEHPKDLHDLHSDLLFLPEGIKINKCNKLVCNLYHKKNYVIHIRSLKQALNNGLVLKKVHK